MSQQAKATVQADNEAVKITEWRFAPGEATAGSVVATAPGVGLAPNGALGSIGMTWAGVGLAAPGSDVAPRSGAGIVAVGGGCSLPGAGRSHAVSPKMSKHTVENNTSVVRFTRSLLWSDGSPSICPTTNVRAGRCRTGRGS